MGRITDEDIARVREATDLVAVVSERVVLRQKGRLFWGNCPFHGEKTPSFKIDPAIQTWHCFGCGAGGDVFGYVMRTDNVEFPDAVRILADRANIEITEAQGGVPRGRKERLFAALEEAAEYYHRVLTGSRDQKAADARQYLAGRGFGSEIARQWTLGYAPGRGALVKHLTDKGYSADEIVDADLALRNQNGQVRDRFYERIMFPIRDLQGRVVAFGGRVMGQGEPKYLNTKDTAVFSKSSNMFGIERAKGPMTATGTAVVVEGYTDVIALHAAGIDSAVATLGTALTQQHIKLLGRFAKKVVYLFDGDAAGMRAADRAAEFLDVTASPESGKSRVELKVAVIPDGLDPADYVGRNGEQPLRELVDGARGLLEFAVERRLDRWNLDVAEERLRALRDAAEVLAPIRGLALADEGIRLIFDRLAGAGMIIRPEQVAAAIPARPRSPQEYAAQADQPVVEMPGISAPTSSDARAERDIIALMILHPPIRPQAQELLAESLLADENYRSMAQVLADADPGMAPAALLGLIEEHITGAASVLSGAEYGDVEPEEAAGLGRSLVRRLKEFDLERRIAVGKGRLGRRDSFKDMAQYDDLFRELAVLERKLAKLRAGEDE